jgi:SPRY domain/UBA/TS-N domain
MKKTSDCEKETRFNNYQSIFTVKIHKTLGPSREASGASQSSNSSEALMNSGDTGGTSQEDRINTGRSVSHSTSATNVDDDEDSETAATAAAHLREAAIAQMSELGLPRSWSDFALRRTGGVNIEAAVTFCLERGPEIERMIAEEQERERLAPRDFSGGSVTRRRGNRDTGLSNRLLRQLLEMGFPRRWCAEALSVTGNNVDEALTWILNNGERLSEEDEAIEAGGENEETNDDEAESVDDEDEDDTEVDDSPNDGNVVGSEILEGGLESSEPISDLTETIPCWSGSIIPLRFISGRAIVDPTRMEISGLPAGGFSSVGTKGILLTSGKWYYEAILETAGCLQIGWADGSFAGHCHADRGDGCGDGPSSWAFDGWRRYRWHATATEWGCRWKEGDVVGCLVDMDKRVVSFTLNGQGESVGMGVAFTEEGFRPCGGVYACVSFNRKEKLRLILGGNGSELFKHQPPDGYRGVGEAVLAAVKERDHLLSKEVVLDSNKRNERSEAIVKRFICDFSDADHGHELTAWAHRYYGSDASVHLGAVRSKRSAPKSPSHPTSSDVRYSSYLTRRLQKTWSHISTPQSDDVASARCYEEIAACLFDGYRNVEKRLNDELYHESLTVAVLLSRKILLHILITEGEDFNLGCFVRDNSDHLDIALKFWNVVEVCTSLRSAGWVGEAGAMAVAAEALGLCISSNEQLQSRSSGERRGVVIASDLDEHVQLPTGGFTQVLSCVLSVKSDESVMNIGQCRPANAEAALGSDGGGGSLAFLQEGLRSAICKSSELRRIMVAKIRRGVRHLAVVEYDSDECERSNQREVCFSRLCRYRSISISNCLCHFYL